MKTFFYKNTNIILGENKHENWKLLKISDPEHFFIHLNSFPSGHVVVQNDIYNEEIVKYAGQICKNHSKYKNLKDIKICYCKYKNILKGDEIGEIYFKSNRQVKTFIE